MTIPRAHGNRRLLIATDGSRHSEAALRTALELIEPDMQVTVVAVVEIPLLYPDVFADPTAIDREANGLQECAQAALDDARKLLTSCGVHANYVLRSGLPAEEVLAAARQLAPWLVVLGSHGHNVWQRMLLGSVSEAVLHRWNGATLIVRLPNEAALPVVPRAARARLVSEVMTPQPFCALVTTTLKEAACRMRDLGVGALPVLLDEHLVGVITDRDIAVAAVADGVDPVRTTVELYKSRTVHCIAPTATVGAAAQLMATQGVRRLMVVDAERLVGIVSLGDLAETLPSEAAAVLVEVSRSRSTLAHEILQR